MNRSEQIQSHLDLMCEIVITEITSAGGRISRIDLVSNLGLKMSSYPLESTTQTETTWLCNILIRKLQNEGRVTYHGDSANRVSYSLS
jgi:hypothetical protein